MPSASVVVASNRPDRLAQFLRSWEHGLDGATIHVVHDGPEPPPPDAGAVRHHSWTTIDADLGEHAWIIPRGTGCIRSYGCLAALRDQPEMIVVLDDDCLPDPDHPDFLATHWERLHTADDEAWVSTLDGVDPRGMPYHVRSRSPRVVLNHGLWTGVPDYDAVTQLVATRVELDPVHRALTIPRGSYFPMCSMNLAWRPELTPAMYFLLMGPDEPYDRFGDIWAGVFVKRVADHLGLAVNSGPPAIHHERASNVWANLVKEAPGLAVNERLWQAVDDVVLTQRTIAGAYRELADELRLDDPYFTRLRAAMRIWADLCDVASPDLSELDPV